MTENARPQDVARPHRRTRGAPAPETEALLERYRAALRAELEELLRELWPVPPETGQLDLAGQLRRDLSRPKLAERRELWDLAVKIARELSSSSSSAETAWSGLSPAPAELTRRPARAPRLTKREREQL